MISNNKTYLLCYDLAFTLSYTTQHFCCAAAQFSIVYIKNAVWDAIAISFTF